MQQVMHALVLAILAVGIGVLGRWGRTRSAHLVPSHLQTGERQRKIRTIERGGAACYLAAGVLLAVAVLAVV